MRRNAYLPALAVFISLLGQPSVAEPLGKPLTLALVVDTAGCIRGPDRSDVPWLTRRLLMQLPARSRVAIFAAERQPRLLQELMANAARDLENLIEETDLDQDGAALNDALYMAGEYLKERPRGRIAMLIISGGRDEGSLHSIAEVQGLAQSAGFPIFVLGMEADAEAALANLARNTGGEYFIFQETSQFALASAIDRKTPARACPPHEPPAPPLSIVSYELILGFTLPLALGLLLALKDRARQLLSQARSGKGWLHFRN